MPYYNMISVHHFPHQFYYSHQHLRHVSAITDMIFNIQNKMHIYGICKIEHIYILFWVLNITYLKREDGQNDRNV